jgi:hypothetical protein
MNKKGMLHKLVNEGEGAAGGRDDDTPSRAAENDKTEAT